MIMKQERRGIIIKVVGVGGGGIRIVEQMTRDKVEGLELIAADTDQLELNGTHTAHRLLLGFSVTKGKGAGSDPALGRRACVESSSEIKRKLEGADMIFIVAGMGGGTGSGGVEVVATVAREIGALTVAVVTTPFDLEGLERVKRAQLGIETLRHQVDSLIVIPGNRLLKMIGDQPVAQSLDEVTRVPCSAVQSLTDLMTLPALLTLNFSDVQNVMSNRGLAVFSTGRGQGDAKAVQAAKAAITSPLVGFKVKDAQQAIVSIVGGEDTSLNEANQAVQIVRNALGASTNIVFGIAVDRQLQNELVLSMIVTGVTDKRVPESSSAPVSKPVPPSNRELIPGK